jgi:hypothetical protein
MCRLTNYHLPFVEWFDKKYSKDDKPNLCTSNEIILNALLIIKKPCLAVTR